MVNISIIGYGFVGQAVHASLKEVDDCKRTLITTIYDKNKDFAYKLEQFTNTNNSHYVFVCVGTPKNNYDDFCEVMDHLVKKTYVNIVIVKSTVPYSILKKYTEKLNIVFSPEFLNQNSSIDDSINQNYIVLGGEYIFTSAVVELYDNTIISNNNPTIKHTTIETAIDFKYVRNIYGAYKVLFWEYVQDVTGNARLMAEMLKNVPQGEMSQVGMDAERGYGGACFPKDVVNYNAEKEHDLTKFMIDLNKYYNGN